jgi:hypothetical protein
MNVIFDNLLLRALSEAIHLGHIKKDGLPRRPKSLLAMTALEVGA